MDTREPLAAFNDIFLIIVAICVVGILTGIWIGRHHKKCLAGLRSFEKMTGMKSVEEA